MMLKEKSNPWARMKYLYVLPLAAVAVAAFARPEVSNKVEEISAVKVNDLAAIVETNVIENIVSHAPIDSVKHQARFDSSITPKDTILTYTGNSKLVFTGINYFSSKDNPLIIINGKESNYVVWDAIAPERIKSVSFLKGENATKIYGDKSNKGVLVVELYSSQELEQKKKESKKKVELTLDALNGNKKSWITNFSSVNGKQPLIIVDGKEAENQFLSNISPNRIKSISVLKDKSALSAYGEKAKEGVIEVNLLTEDEFLAKKNNPHASHNNPSEIAIEQIRVDKKTSNSPEMKGKVFYICDKGVSADETGEFVVSGVNGLAVMTSKGGDSRISYSLSKGSAEWESVSGTVKDENGNPIAQATILVKGTSSYTQSDAQGRFAIRAPKDGILNAYLSGMSLGEMRVDSKVDFILKKLAEKTE